MIVKSMGNWAKSIIVSWVWPTREGWSSGVCHWGGVGDIWTG